MQRPGGRRAGRRRDQADLEHRPAGRRVAALDVRAVVLERGARRGEPEPEVGVALGRDEPLEQLGEHRGRDPRPGVAHDHVDHAVVVAQLDLDPAPVGRHRIERVVRVHHQVEHDLVDQHRIAAHRGHRRQRGVDLDRALAQHRLDHDQDVLDDLRQVRGLGRGRRHARQPLQPRHQIADRAVGALDPR
ncbi:MAG TPA: hypothetical protein VHW23_40565 [Kofleriaceae bacterium]|nr:hypothetical protein [Kofleriaceae bacterium]